ncbi:LuxR C-terminal-related transcriptional regulator [Streptomyces sp. NPDC090493]|uniref:LuxR C-terminal-related transcriptional regulator n=1 Tax=Streptomyces sp. NPDC090493 TaxID=3365964 RepID=UPI00381E790C
MPDDQLPSSAEALPTGELPLWVPLTRIIQVPCGEHFDAIRVGASEAQRAHKVLGPASGPVLACAYTQTWHFLLDPGAAVHAVWNAPGTRALRCGTLLGIPPVCVTRGRDVRWIVPPGRGTTDPAALYHALTGRRSHTPSVVPMAAPRKSFQARTFPVLEGTIFTPRSAAELTRLTPTEKRVAEHLVAGYSNAEGAGELGMSATSFSGHISNIGRKFRADARPARAHAVLASGQVPPPSAASTAPVLDSDERRLLRALAEHSDTYAIARASGIAAADVRERIEILVAKAGAVNDTHLIGLCHAWGFLGIKGPGTVQCPQDQPAGAA